jgi:hypothetical protein
MGVKYITTWICIDSSEDASYFPSSKGLSSDAKVQHIYWKCVLVFFTSLQKFISGEKLILFTNADALPHIDGVDVAAVLSDLGVEVRHVVFGFKVPKGYFKSWTNQFFEFSIIEHISENFENDDTFLMLDSDCVFRGGLDHVFKLAAEKTCITYTLDYPESEIINGISRVQMKGIYQSLLGKPVTQVPVYHAGEFLMANKKAIKEFRDEFRWIWPELLTLHKEHKPKLVEEAHVLSFIYFIRGYVGGEANAFIKRIWTDPTNFRNVSNEDLNYIIWHVPAEKKFGIERIYQIFRRRNFDLSDFDLVDYMQLISRELTIPIIPLKRKAYFLGKKSLKRLGKFLKSVNS